METITVTKKGNKRASTKVNSVKEAKSYAKIYDGIWIIRVVKNGLVMLEIELETENGEIK